MTAKGSVSTTDRPYGGGRKLSQRVMPFVALLLTVPVALAVGGILHLVLADSAAGLALTSAGIVAGTCGMALVAHGLGRKRQPLVQWQVTVTVALTGLAEAVTVAVGLPRWWVLTFTIAGVFVAGSWGLHRIDALRQRQADTSADADTLTKKLGLEETRFRRPQVHRDPAGDVTRIEVPVQHAPGQTVEVLQQAVPAIESLADAPRGRSRAVPGEGAGQSTLVIITKDVLKELVPYPGPSAPGGCITEPLVTSVGEDHQPGRRFIAGGHKDAPNPSSTGWMGMTRTGKTMNAQVGAMELISRRNVQMFWFDTIKGAQTVRPMRHGLDVVVASDDPRTFRVGMKALMNLIQWRAQRLGECGYRAWIPECALDPKLEMPFLVAHFEEADALCDIAPDEMVFLASKGLSTGVACEISLQRADATSMPTGLRFNIGNWYCFGTGDPYSAGFALSDHTINAGAHPENWKQSKPGYHYFEGIGVPDERWPVTHKSMYADDAQMELHTRTWAPQMMPLDAGSVAALGDWYRQSKADTVALVARWDAGPDATPVVHDGAATSTNTPLTAAADTFRVDTGDNIDAQIQEEIAEMMADGTIDPLDTETSAIDTGRPIPPPPADAERSWADKEAAPTAEAAAEAFDRALRELAEDDSLQDPDDDRAVVFQVATLVDRYKFRSRPWFSARLTAVIDGDVRVDGLALERTDRSGQYRLIRTEALAVAGDRT